MTARRSTALAGCAALVVVAGCGRVAGSPALKSFTGSVTIDATTTWNVAGPPADQGTESLSGMWVVSGEQAEFQGTYSYHQVTDANGPTVTLDGSAHVAQPADLLAMETPTTGQWMLQFKVPAFQVTFTTTSGTTTTTTEIWHNDDPGGFDADYSYGGTMAPGRAPLVGMESPAATLAAHPGTITLGWSLDPG